MKYAPVKPSLHMIESGLKVLAVGALRVVHGHYIIQFGDEEPSGTLRELMPGITRPRKTYQPGTDKLPPDLPWYGGRHIQRDSCVFTSHLTAGESKTGMQTVHKGDIILTAMVPYRAGICPKDGVCNTGKTIVIPIDSDSDNFYAPLVLATVTQPRFHEAMKDMASGSDTRGTVTVEGLLNIPIVVPHNSEVMIFNQMVEPVIQAMAQTSEMYWSLRCLID